MENSLRLSVVLPATPEQVYTAWLSTEKHSAFTGSPAAVDARGGGALTAWDGYSFNKKRGVSCCRNDSVVRDQGGAFEKPCSKAPAFAICSKLCYSVVC